MNFMSCDDASVFVQLVVFTPIYTLHSIVAISRYLVIAEKNGNTDNV